MASTQASDSICVVDIGALFHPPHAARDEVDAALWRGAHQQGFLIVNGLPPEAPVGGTARRALLRAFDLQDRERRRLWRRKFAPENGNLYRGWFPAQPGNLTSKEGIDIGADVAHGLKVTDPGDPLCEPTPLPPEASLPGWRHDVAAYYLGMERIARALMQSIARSLDLEEGFFDAAFRQGLSTLRLLEYPLRSAGDLAACTDPELWVAGSGQARYVVAAAHTDSGFMTLLAQDGVPGLQARGTGGDWIEVTPLENSLVVNFGQVLERWSGGRIRATEHRVLGAGRVRHSIPFFYEARADALISPLPHDPASFAPFLYGDYLWARIVKFVEFRGMDAQRVPRRGAA